MFSVKSNLELYFKATKRFVEWKSILLIYILFFFLLKSSTIKDSVAVLEP